ncbi:MAG: hypothetical protein L3J23_02085 [Flavobacteriaceae bacterium]|nr:hypothetical protein [Flavobacteriaceae bacterium]
MKYIYSKILILFLISIVSFSCKTKTDKKSELSNIVKNNKIKSKCLIKSDSLEIKKFIKKLIYEIEHNKVELFSSKFVYPISMFDFSFENEKEFTTQWNKNDRLRDYLSLDIDDENDKFIEKSNILNTRIIFSKSNKNGCYRIQFGLGSGLLFNVDRIGKDIKIVKFDTAG